MIEKTSKITGLIHIKYSELTKEEKEISTYVRTLRHSFLELPEESHNSKRCLFVQPDTVQPVEKYGIIMYKYILQLRLDKRIAK